MLRVFLQHLLQARASPLTLVVYVHLLGGSSLAWLMLLLLLLLLFLFLFLLSPWL